MYSKVTVELQDMSRTVKPRYNETLFKEVLGIKKDFRSPSNGKIYEKEPLYSEQISPVSWLFVISRFHCTS